MLDMGFIHDIKRILKLLPKKRQTLMFSATFSSDIRKLAKQFLHEPREVSVTPNNSTAKTVSQLVHPVDKSKKAALLKYLVKANAWDQVLVFVRTKHGANKLTKQLASADINAAAIHGNKSQGARTKALAQFKNGELQALVATDIAARGIDIDELPHVVNYDLPNVPEDYVHRIGRTGRAGEQIDGFEPVDEVSDTPKSPSRPAARKPKKHRSKKKKHAGGQSSNQSSNNGGGNSGQSLYQGKKKKAAGSGRRRRRPAVNKATG